MSPADCVDVASLVVAASVLASLLPVLAIFLAAELLEGRRARARIARLRAALHYLGTYSDDEVTTEAARQTLELDDELGGSP